MTARPVITWGDPRLKINSADIGEWTPELERLVEDMFETGLEEALAERLIMNVAHLGGAARRGGSRRA